MTSNSNGRRVAVTGMGFITPIGSDLETVWSNMVEGVSGVSRITRFDTAGFDTKIAAEVKGFNPEEYMDRKTARHIGRYCQFALAASKQALAQAGLDPAQMEPDDVGVIVSSGIGGMEEIEKSHTALLERGPKRISPFTVPMMIADMAAGIVAIHTQAGGPNYAIVSACASSAHGIGEASEIIKRGDAVAMLAGGSEATITPLTMGAFCQIKATSERNDEPEKACRPFDLGRDGFVMGEGSVMFVLEDMDHAKARGARILAEIAGYGASADMYHFTAPQPEGKGAMRAMRHALETPSRRPLACSPWTAGCCRRRSTSTTLIPSATSTTCRTGRARRTSMWPSPTRSDSAATTPPSSSRKPRMGSNQEEGLPMANQLDFKELQDLAAEILGIDPDQVQMNVSFQRDLAADSLDLVELIAAVEDKYDVELPEEELEKMNLIADLWKVLEQRAAERLEA